MATSQNGWAANDRSVIDTAASAAGVRFPGGVRHDAPGKLLMAVAERFHSEVEALRDGWCWGYAERDIRGSNAVSNHASGTAIDCNAPNHPLGQSGTFSGAQAAQIRQIVADTGHVVRWGGDYSGRKDEMHFEINNGQSMADCQRALAAIDGTGNGGTGTTEEDAMIGLQKGDSGQRVKGLQALIQYAGVELDQYGVDGDYGDETAEGLRQVRENVGSQAKSGYGDRVDGWGYAQLMKAVARNNG